MCGEHEHQNKKSAVWDTLPNLFHSMSYKKNAESTKNFFHFPDTTVSQKVYMDLNNALLTTLTKKVCSLSYKVSSQSAKILYCSHNTFFSRSIHLDIWTFVLWMSILVLIRLPTCFAQNPKEFRRRSQKTVEIVLQNIFSKFFLLDRYNADLATLLNTFYRNAGHTVKNLDQIFSLVS